MNKFYVNYIFLDKILIPKVICLSMFKVHLTADFNYESLFLKLSILRYLCLLNFKYMLKFSFLSLYFNNCILINKDKKILLNILVQKLSIRKNYFGVCYYLKFDFLYLSLFIIPSELLCIF